MALQQTQQARVHPIPSVIRILDIAYPLDFFFHFHLFIYEPTQSIT